MNVRYCDVVKTINQHVRTQHRKQHTYLPIKIHVLRRNHFSLVDGGREFVDVVGARLGADDSRKREEEGEGDLHCDVDGWNDGVVICISLFGEWSACEIMQACRCCRFQLVALFS